MTMIKVWVLTLILSAHGGHNDWIVKTPVYFPTYQECDAQYQTIESLMKSFRKEMFDTKREIAHSCTQRTIYAPE